MPKKTLFETLKKKVKQKSSWEAVSLVAGAFGIFISPEHAVEIVGGVFAIVGGIRGWMNEVEEKEE